MIGKLPFILQLLKTPLLQAREVLPADVPGQDLLHYVGLELLELVLLFFPPVDLVFPSDLLLLHPLHR